MLGLNSIYEGNVYRPPSEASSLILQATLGCSWNRCTFCSMYLDKPFRIRSLSELKHDIDRVLPRYESTHRIFLADGNALAIPTDQLLETLSELFSRFPALERVSLYGGPQDIRAKSQDELEALREAGLGIIYLGLESGSAAVLKAVRKGATPKQMIDAGQKVARAGIPLSAIVISGLGGTERTEEHALETARVLSAMGPRYIGCLTLMVHPRCAIAEDVRAGRVTLLSPDEVLAELELLVGALELDPTPGNETIFRANHASNYAPLRATLPREQRALMREIKKLRQRGAFKPEWARGL